MLPRHPAFFDLHMGLGELLLARNRPAEAVSQFEQALTIPSAEGVWRAEAQFMLARSLWSERQDLSRSLSLANQAREYYQSTIHEQKLAVVSKWLAAHHRRSHP